MPRDHAVLIDGSSSFWLMTTAHAAFSRATRRVLSLLLGPRQPRLPRSTAISAEVAWYQRGQPCRWKLRRRKRSFPAQYARSGRTGFQKGKPEEGFGGPFWRAVRGILRIGRVVGKKLCVPFDLDRPQRQELDHETN